MALPAEKLAADEALKNGAAGEQSAAPPPEGPATAASVKVPAEAPPKAPGDRTSEGREVTRAARHEAADVDVRPVRSRADRDAFIQLPFSLYEGDAHWVPPLIMERRDFLDPKKNPWFQFGTAELFLAWRDGEVVGRIAAVHDPRYNEFHGVEQGFFGMFECVNEVGVARALFDAAAGWVRSRGFGSMMGPVGFSLNYESGVLVDGFDKDPYVLMAYNPPYYPALYEACGFAKAKDLWAWDLRSAQEPAEKVVRIAEKVRVREGITVRPVRMREFRAELDRVKDIYNSAWERNWGFVPMTDAEFEHLARELKQMVVPELALVAELNGEPIAFSLAVPDANVALKAAGGRLTRFGLPIGLAKLLNASRKIKNARLIILGVKEQYRKRGIDAILYLDTIRAARKLGYDGGELGWTLEDNQLINRAVTSLGARHYKTYRIYEKSLGPKEAPSS